jgi:hypothetical protein
MKRVLCVVCLLFLAAAALAQSSAVSGTSAVYGQIFVKRTTTGRSEAFIYVAGIGITNHVFDITVQGSPASCTVLLETSTDAVTWSTAFTETCTSNKTVTLSGTYNWVTANLSVLSGGTSPNLTVAYRGYLPGQGLPVRPAEGGTGTTTVLTTGSIPFIIASGVFSQDNSNLFWDATNKRLCLLTATCVNTLDVNGGRWFVTSSGATTATGETVNAPSSSSVARTTVGASGQSADLDQWKNSGGTVLASVSSAGIPKGNRLDNNVPLSGTVKADYAVTTVANTITETVLSSYSIPANSLAANRVIRVTASGVYSTANATDTVTIRGRIAASTWHNVVNTAATVTNAQWSASWIIIVATTGAGGTAESQLPWVFINSVVKHDPATAAKSIDTTLARTLDITAQWSAAAAANTISIRQFVVEVLN